MGEEEEKRGKKIKGKTKREMEIVKRSRKTKKLGYIYQIDIKKENEYER